MKKTELITGYCPLLSCLEQKPHTHPICPECEAVNFGNLFCSRCRNYHGIELAKDVIEQ